MRLSPPSLMTLLISVVLAIAALLAQLGIVQIPVIGSGPFAALAVSYLLLLMGNVVRGL